MRPLPLWFIVMLIQEDYFHMLPFSVQLRDIVVLFLIIAQLLYFDVIVFIASCSAIPNLSQLAGESVYTGTEIFQSHTVFTIPPILSSMLH